MSERPKREATITASDLPVAYEWREDTPNEGWHEITNARVYRKGYMLVICATPDSEIPDEHSHNCDVMGCSSLDHVVLRGRAEIEG